MKQAQFLKQVEDALAVQQALLAEMNPLKENPSAASSYHRTYGRVSALEAVARAIRGDTLELRLMGI